MKHIVIIGGGISGLAAAHRLTELSSQSNQRIKITLLEAGPRPGGVIQTVECDGYLVECGPDSFISEKPEAVALAKRLGVESQLIETNSQFRRSFIVRNGKLSPIPEGFQLLAPTRLWPFVKSDIFSLPGKIRMAADLLLPRRQRNGVDDESLANFVRRRLGREALVRMAQPMVGGIYTADPERLSLKATLPRFLEMERDHRSVILGMIRRGRSTAQNNSGVSGARYSLFLSFDRGMQVLVDALVRRLQEEGIEIRLNTKVESINKERSWNIRTASEEVIPADALCLALPSQIAASLIGSTSVKLEQSLRQITYASTATINLGYRRKDIKHPLDGFGFVVPFAEKRSLMACTFSSVKFAGRAPETQVLLRAFVGGALQPEMFTLDENETIARVKADLSELLGIKNEPLFVKVARWPESMPQYEVGHTDRIAEIERGVRSLGNFALSGNAYSGVGIPDCIRSGELAAQELFDTACLKSPIS